MEYQEPSFLVDEPLNLDGAGTNSLRTYRHDVKQPILEGSVLKHKAMKAWLDVLRAYRLAASRWMQDVCGGNDAFGAMTGRYCGRSDNS